MFNLFLLIKLKFLNVLSVVNLLGFVFLFSVGIIFDLKDVLFGVFLLKWVIKFILRDLMGFYSILLCMEKLLVLLKVGLFKLLLIKLLCCLNVLVN